MKKRKRRKDFINRTKRCIFVTNVGYMKKETIYNTEEESELDLIMSEPAMSYTISSFDLIGISRRGIFKETLMALAKKLSFTMHEISRILHLSERTIQRYKSKDRLSPDSSERVLLLAGLYERGLDIFGNAHNFTDWLRTPLSAFDGQQPIDFLDTSFGFQIVEDELVRIEHGVFA